MSLTSTSGKRMLGYLPPYYGSSRVMAAVLQAQGAELDKLRQALDAVLDQAFVARATWGLDIWERELGLPVAPNAPDSERRRRIISRLRGTGTATSAVVRQVAESYDNGRVAVIEDHPGYRVIVRFTDTHGVPANIDDIKLSLGSVVPAHLDLVYEYTYLVWTQLDAKGLTWDALDAQALTFDGLEVWS